MVVACVALAVALGGTGYAASTLPEKSVGRKQIQNGAVGNLQIRDGAITTGKIKGGAVTSAKVKNGTLKAGDFAKGVLTPAPVTTVRQASGDPIAPGAAGAVSASCNPGERATGGGGGLAGAAAPNDHVVDSIPVGDAKPVVKWRVTLVNGGTEARAPVAYVICVAP